MSGKLFSLVKRGCLYGAACALLLQSLYPSGYMPASISGGWIAMLCPEGLPVEFAAGLSQQHQGHHSSPHQRHHQADLQHHGAEAGHQAFAQCDLGSALDQPFSFDHPDILLPIAIATSTTRLQGRTDAISAFTVGYRPRAPPIA
jgi:hypothetical protein